MFAGDSEDFDGEQMAKVQQPEDGNKDLLDTQEGILNKEEHSNLNAPTADTEGSKIQELLDEETEKSLKQLDLKREAKTSSTKGPVTKNYEGDLEKDKDELQSNSGSGCNLPNYPSTQTLSEIEETVLQNEVDTTAFSFNATMNESLVKHSPKNPFLLTPVIRCALKFLNIEDLKNARLVCREWGSMGKLALGSRALIQFRKYEVSEKPDRLPVDFQSCFQDSAALFSAFKISDNLTEFEFACDPCLWRKEEFTSFFEEQRKYLKELTLDFKCSKKNMGKRLKISSWISQSPMVRNDVKCLTKLSIHGYAYAYGRKWDIPPLHLIAHIKDLSLSRCTINVEPGIKISSIKLKLDHAMFFQDGIRLDRVRINDIVEVGKAKEMSLYCWKKEVCTEYVLDVYGSDTFQKLIFEGYGIEIVNGEASRWAIEHLMMTATPYSLNSQMNIKELYLSQVGTLDLFTLPNSIQKLFLHGVNDLTKLHCSQPIVFPNLQYLHIAEPQDDVSFLSHFMNCPQLIHLMFFDCPDVELKSLWMPKTIKTLTLDDNTYGIKWVDEGSWNLETLVVDIYRISPKFSETNIRADNIVVYESYMPKKVKVDTRLAKFLEQRKLFGFCKRLFIGELNWDDKQFAESVLKEHFEEWSAFYVFQDGQKGCAVSEKDFHALIPKHLEQHFRKFV